MNPSLSGPSHFTLRKSLYKKQFTYIPSVDRCDPLVAHCAVLGGLTLREDEKLATICAHFRISITSAEGSEMF